MVPAKDLSIAIPIHTNPHLQHPNRDQSTQGPTLLYQGAILQLSPAVCFTVGALSLLLLDYLRMSVFQGAWLNSLDLEA